LQERESFNFIKIKEEKMKMRHALTIVVVLSILVWGGNCFAQQMMPPPPPPHPMFGGPPPAATVCADGKYLYVVCGPKIHQYSIPDLKLQKTVELPKPTPPEKK
jgi:hypothetical protein